METTLVVNPGSSSRKYALYCDGKLSLEVRFEDTDNGFERCSQVSGSQQVCESIKKDDFDNSFSNLAEEIDSYLFKTKSPKLQVVIVRVVAPGTFFQQHMLIDDAYLQRLKEHESVAPLHIPIILSEIKNIKKSLKDVKIVAASDSAFHSEMPARAREYSIMSQDAKDYDIYKFGYHGLSVSSIVRRVHSIIGQDPERMIVCHIGNGVSVTAVKKGKSVDTSMGFSPTSGLPMGSRAGDLDATALLELMRVKHWRTRDAELYLNTRCGLAGVAGESDIRTLLDRRSHNDKDATQALDLFAYSIQKSVAAQTVALGGLDVIVLTATAVTRSSELRSLVMSGLEHLGVKISEDRNNMLVGKDGVISIRNSAVKVVVMKTDEMGEMFQVAQKFNSTPSTQSR